MKLWEIAVPLVLLFNSAHVFAKPMIEVGNLSRLGASKVSIVVGPEALRAASASHAPGESNWVSVDLDVGLFSGIRADLLPYSDEHLSVALEGFYGGALLSPAYGGGVRVQFRVVAGQSNALLISPGLDVYLSPPDSSFLGHSGNLVYVLANADLEWLHEFANHFGFELGARLGGGIQAGGESGVRPVPDVDLFTGLRF
jgi:hypothetical protein